MNDFTYFVSASMKKRRSGLMRTAAFVLQKYEAEMMELGQKMNETPRKCV